MFGMPKREPDIREWLVIAIDPFHTSNREKRDDLVLPPCTACRCETTGYFRSDPVLHSNRYVAPLVNEMQCCGSVAVRLLYTGHDENISSAL